MTNIEKRFLTAYRCALDGRTVTELPEGDSGWKELSAPEWRKLFSIAERHRVFPMVLEAVFPALESSAAGTRYCRSLQKKAEEQTCGQARMSAEFLKLYRFLQRKGLSPLVMKGVICRNLYPNPEQRSSSDEDLLIPETDYGRYHEALLAYGLHIPYPDADPEKDHEIPYCSSRVYIELHKQPFPPESKAYGDLNRFFDEAGSRAITETVYGVPVRTMCCTDHLFYQLCHACKHFLNCGIGIRLVSDIVLYSIANEERIDWDTVTQRCREIHAFDFAATLYKIGEKYLFPDRFPEHLRQIWSTETVEEEALLADILIGGVYGTSSEDRLHSANLTLHAAEEAKTGKRTSVLAGTLFPAYAGMKRRYPWLKRLPFLLPAAWLHRIISYGSRSIFHGRNGNRASEAVRIGQERVALMRRYRMIEERKKEGSLLKRAYQWTHTSFLAPVLRPVYVLISMTEFYALNLIWFFRGSRMPTRQQKRLVRENVTFIVKSFERQHLVRGLCRNIALLYPGTAVVVADDSRKPLHISRPNVQVIQLPFNSGLSAGLQAALAEVKTPYVVRLDDDELLTIKSNVHRELGFLMRHPELDLIGFGHTTAIRLHSPEFNFRDYYQSPMEDAPRPLRIPHLTKLDDHHIVLGKVANIYLARTEKIREVGFDPQIRVIDHHDFFWRAAGIITSAAALDTVVFHRHNPYERAYNTYRSDFAADLEYIRKKRIRQKQEVNRNEKKTLQ